MNRSAKDSVSVQTVVDWLQGRWGLADSTLQNTVRDLLLAESGGDTAILLPWGQRDPALWGNAANGHPDNLSSPLLVVDRGGDFYLQTRRCYEAERVVAERIAHFCRDNPVQAGAHLFSEFFPGAGSGDLQVMAAQTALRSRITLITGGPGVGKTWTLARILALFMRTRSVPAEKIALAAPTGKAADRMRDAITGSAKGLDASEAESLIRVASRSSTLHRLLGFNPATGKCHHGLDNRLPWKLLIIDESSMVDLHLWRVLLDSVADDARLILLGDPKQLQSVGQGAVFGDLAGHAGKPTSPLYGRKVHLTVSRRFAECPGIAALAEAMQDDDSESAIGILSESTGEDGDLVWIDTGERHPSFDRFPQSLRDSLLHIAREEDPAKALKALESACILTPHRNSVIGAEALSRGITRAVAALIPGTRIPNEPVIINRNDPETGLKNGSLGITVTDDQNRRRTWFHHGNTNRDFSPGALPDHSSAWAITIHRSQGSEYDQVLVILPRKESVMATRELLYTAITRARKKVIVAGDLDAVKRAVESPSDRLTLLQEALSIR